MLRTIFFACLISSAAFLRASAAAEDERPLPLIERLVPNSIEACSLQTGISVAVVGDFPAGTRILLDGAGVPVVKAGRHEIIFALPDLAGGLYRVEAVTRENRRSLPQALVIDEKPEIRGITLGEDRVTAYEVVIDGSNFLYESTLVVNGAALRPARPDDPVNGEPPPVGGKDYVRYEDCSTLVYVRHPLTRAPETVTLRVVNPGGEQSPGYEVEIP